MPYLVCHHTEKNERWKVELGEQPVHIGRSKTAEISIRDLSVSKTHVRIERRSGRFHFRDLGSKNGTYINEFRREDGPLDDGDELRVGKILVQFLRTVEQAQHAVANPPASAFESGPGAVGSADQTGAAGSVGSAAAAGAPATSSGAAGGTAGSDRTYAEQTVHAVFDTSPNSSPAARANPQKQRSAERGDPTQTGESIGLGALLGVGVLCIAIGFLAGWFTRGPGDSRSSTSLAATNGDGDSSQAQNGDAENGNGGNATGSGSDSLRSGDGSPKSGNGSVLTGNMGNAGSETPSTAVGDSSSPKTEGPDPNTDWVAAVGGPRASLSNSATSRRVLFRLSLDLLNRPPTRQEVSRWLPLNHEERWTELSRVAGSEFPDLSSLSAIFTRFIGRATRPEEEDRLRFEHSTKPEVIARQLASSARYASVAHQRERSAEQRASSLWVDLRDKVPSAADRQTMKAALEEKSGDAEEIVRILLNAGEDEIPIGPSAMDLDVGPWIATVYNRFLLRAATGVEVQSAEDEIERQVAGWQYVVQSLAVDPAYARY